MPAPFSVSSVLSCFNDAGIVTLFSVICASECRLIKAKTIINKKDAFIYIIFFGKIIILKISDCEYKDKRVNERNTQHNKNEKAYNYAPAVNCLYSLNFRAWCLACLNG
jgi:hypothetical protein